MNIFLVFVFVHLADLLFFSTFEKYNYRPVQVSFVILSSGSKGELRIKWSIKNSKCMWKMLDKCKLYLFCLFNSLTRSGLFNLLKQVIIFVIVMLKSFPKLCQINFIVMMRGKTCNQNIVMREYMSSFNTIWGICVQDCQLFIS